VTTSTATQIDQARLEGIVGQAISDFSGAVTSALVVIGDKLGLYRALATGPATAEELAARTGTSERYLRHWCLNQAASGFVDYSPETGRYSLSPEQALAFADDDSPAAMAGGYELMLAAVKAAPKITEAMLTGKGLSWGEHDPGLFTGTARFFKPGYVGNIAQNWIPALPGIAERLAAGGTVADIGCGFGHSTIIMASAYPNARFFGFDTHAPSIAEARKGAEQAGVSDRVVFEVASAQDFPGRDYDLITFFDCLHDMGDPLGAARTARAALSPQGSVMLVEPMAGERIEDNFNPVGRLFSAASVLICTPHAISEGGKALGTIATDSELKAIFDAAGFGTFRRASESPTNRVFEARP
jgi:SAM-dependent methyltransferase